MVDECFVIRGTAVAEGAVQAARVVPALDVLEDGTAKPRPGLPRTCVDQLALDGGEEALGHGVVPALTGHADREHHAVGPGQLPVVPTGVLTNSPPGASPSSFAPRASSAP